VRFPEGAAERTGEVDDLLLLLGDLLALVAVDGVRRPRVGVAT
jgi:hypothetical protein